MSKSAYELSREIFELNASSEFGAMVSVYDDPMSEQPSYVHFAGKVASMQMELNRWQIRNFGVSSDERMALGFYGEIDELQRGKATKYERLDAWCDMAVFAGQLLMNNRMSIVPIILGFIEHKEGDEIPSVSHIVLKHAQGICGIAGNGYRRQLFEALHIVLFCAWQSHCRNLCLPESGESDAFPHEVDFPPARAAHAYLTIGAEVLKRDWRKFPLNGRDQ